MLLRTSVYPRSLLAAVLAIALLAGCSGSDGSSGDPGGGGSGGGSSGGSGGTGGGTGVENIGPDGGEVTSRDGRLTLIIPEGALDEPTEITIEALEAIDLGDEFEELIDALGETMAYELGPDGLEFNEPITARIASELPLVQDDDSLALHLGLMFTSDGDEVALLDNLRVELDEDDDTPSVSGELDHFSPLVDTVDQLGSSIQFQVFGVPEELEVGESFVAQVTVIAPDEGDGPLQVVAPVSYEDRSTSPIEATFSPTSAELDETARSVYQGTFEYSCADEGADLYTARMTAGVRITLDSGDLVAAETWSNLHQLVECVPAATPAPVNLRLRTFGLGSVVSEPEGIDCDQCEEQIAVFDAGTEITLTATAEQGSEFEGWNGDIETGDDVVFLAEECGDNPVCTFTLESDALVDAYFLTPVATLSVGKSGEGEGSVTTEPAGIDCGPTCVDDQEADFDLGTEVTLTATPEDGSVFVAWHPADGGSAEECGTDPVCTFTLDGDFTYVEAEFQPESATTGETLLTFVAGDAYYTKHLVCLTETGDLEVVSGTITPYATGVEAFQTSPDGTLVAFSVTPNVDGQDTLLQVVPTDASALPTTLSQLMAGGRVTDFGWSPDGSELWYQARPQADSLDLLLNIVDAAGSNHLEVMEDGGLPNVSPTGEYFALVRDSDNDDMNELWTVPWDGAPVQIDADFEDGSFEWTDDGSRLVYREIVGAPIDNTSILRSVLPDGSGLVDLTSGDAMVYEYATAGNYVVWIDDSNIVSQIPEERLRELYASLADGTGSQKIAAAEEEGGIIGLSRAPDGSKVAYMSRNGASGSPFSLNIVEPDGTDLIPISEAADSTGYWSPNSETLVFPSGGIYAVPVDASSAPVELADIAENLQFSADSSCLSYTNDEATPGTNELFATKLEDGEPCFGDSTKVLDDVNVTDHMWRGNTLFSVGYDPIAFMGTFLYGHTPGESPMQAGPFSEVHLR